MGSVGSQSRAVRPADRPKAYRTTGWRPVRTVRLGRPRRCVPGAFASVGHHRIEGNHRVQRGGGPVGHLNPKEPCVACGNLRVEGTTGPERIIQFPTRRGRVTSDRILLGKAGPSGGGGRVAWSRLCAPTCSTTPGAARSC